jgi:eukaryotic-like serine/threonine-protein kinase
MRRNERLEGRFEVLSRAGTGGMGEVYKVLDTTTGQVAARKIMRGSAAAVEERFAREARRLEELRHPAIVRYVAHGATEQGEPYLVMEWLEGEDLAALLRRRRLAADDVVETNARLCAPVRERPGEEALSVLGS